MNKRIILIGLLFAAFSVAAQTPPATPLPSSASPPALSKSLGVVVFPAQNQPADKQSADEGECFAWAKTQTGIDPFESPPAQPPQAESQEAQKGADGSRLRGAARGAAAGAIIGEVADNDAGEGAAIGATVGVLRGGAESRRQKKAAEQEAAARAQQQQADAKATQEQQRAQFNKGFAVCLEARGYTVR